MGMQSMVRRHDFGTGLATAAAPVPSLTQKTRRTRTKPHLGVYSAPALQEDCTTTVTDDPWRDKAEHGKAPLPTLSGGRGGVDCSPPSLVRSRRARPFLGQNYPQQDVYLSDRVTRRCGWTASSNLRQPGGQQDPDPIRHSRRAICAWSISTSGTRDLGFSPSVCVCHWLISGYVQLQSASVEAKGIGKTKPMRPPVRI